MYKNIIFITGNDSFGVDREIKRWIDAFKGKFGDINIDRYDLGDTTMLSNIKEQILMGGLFAEKRLFIFRGGRERKNTSAGIEAILSQYVETIPSDHFLLFHNISEKEAGLIGWLTKEADVRSIDTLWESGTWEQRTNCKKEEIQVVLNTYKKGEGNQERGGSTPLLGHRIAHTLEILSLMSDAGRKFSEKDIEEFCYSYSGNTIFTLVDAICNLEGAKMLQIFHNLTTVMKTDECIAFLIGNLRNTIYVQYLKKYGLGEREIQETIKLHPFVIKKGYTTKIGFEKLKEFYKKIIRINIAYKTGKGMKDTELGKILAIELALLDLQK